MEGTALCFSSPANFRVLTCFLSPRFSQVPLYRILCAQKWPNNSLSEIISFPWTLWVVFFFSFPVYVCIGSLEKQLSCSPAGMLPCKVWKRRQGKCEKEEQGRFSTQISVRISLLWYLWTLQGMQFPAAWATQYKRDCNPQQLPTKVLVFRYKTFFSVVLCTRLSDQQIQRPLFGGPESGSALVRGWGHSSLFREVSEASSEEDGDWTHCSSYITLFHEREMQYDSCSSLEPIKGKKGRRYRRMELSVSHSNILTGSIGRSGGVFGICKTDR